MKKLIYSILVLTLASCEAPRFNHHNRFEKTGHIKKQTLLARVTTYWARGSGTDRDTRNHNGSWVGHGKLKEGICAVDPKKILYGSRVVYPDGSIDIAGDTGKDVKNRRAARGMGKTIEEKRALVVDKFFETKTAANNWAKTNPYFMELKIIPPTTLEN